MAMANIQIDEKIAAILRTQAEARDLPLGNFLQQLATSASPVNQDTRLTDEELDRLIDEASSDSPILPADFNRSDIYSDHD
jgi:hypothetical protein